MKILRNILVGAIAAFVLYFAPSFEDQKVEASKVVAANELTSIAEKYKGIRYRYGGTTTAGFDCSGYVQFVYKQVGVSLSRSTSGMYATGSKVAKSNLQVGDLVFFKTTSAQVGHVGIYVGNNKFIHSSTSKGVMISSINDPYYWGKRYVGAKRVATVATSVAVK